MPTAPTTTGRPPGNAPHGQAAIVIALVLVVLLCATALGVDGARFYAEGLRVQRAADEAALASVAQTATYGDAAGQVSATDVVTRNLAVSSTATVTVAVSYTNSTTGQEKVTVQEQNYPLLFAPIFGLRSGTITRDATAQYTAPLPMGNPSNQLGDTGDAADPNNSIDTYKPDPSGNPMSATAGLVRQNMMLSINGPYQFSESGDPYAPLYVLSHPLYMTGMGPGQVLPNPFRPANFDGYDYRVTIPAGSVPANATNAATYIQVYDAQECNGDAFNDTWGSSQYGLPYTSGSMDGNLYHGPYPTFYRLYEWGAGGKSHVQASDLADPSRGPYPAVASNTLLTDTVIAPNDAFSGNNSCDPNLVGHWYTLAKVKVDPAQGKSYVVNVSTCVNGDALDMYDTSNEASQSSNTSITGASGAGARYNCRGTEVNNFALRAVTVSDGTVACSPNAPDCQTFSPTQTSGVTQPTLAGLGRVSVEVSCARSCSGLTPIYLANVDKTYAGKWLLIKLYDPGDLTGASSMQIVRPNGTYAPFEWYTQTMDGSGKVFTTALRNNGSQSLISSFPATNTASGPPYTTPPYTTTTPPTSTTPISTPICPTQDRAGIVPIGAPAYGQSLSEDNPFDPLHGKFPGCVGGYDYHPWDATEGAALSPPQPGQSNPPPTPPWLVSSADPMSDNTYEGYNLSSGWQNNTCQRDGTRPGSGGSLCNSNYRPFNGRWVYLFTQIPPDYNDPTSSNYYAPLYNPHPGWWYVQYNTQSASPFTDRAVWETQIINTPPHLTN